MHSISRVALIRGGKGVVSRVTGAVLALAAQVVIARLAGISEFGAYAFVLGAINLSVAIAKFGMDTAGLRYFGNFLANGDAPSYRGFRLFSDLIVLAAGLVVALICIAAVDKSHAWSNRPHQVLLIVALVCIPCISLSAVRISALLAFGKVVFGYIPELLFRPAVLIVGSVVIFIMKDALTAEDVLLLLASAAVLSLFASSIAVRYFEPAELGGNDCRQYDVSGWTESGGTFLFSTVTYFALSQADILVVGAVLGDEINGGYAAAARCAVYLSLLMVAIQRTVAPMISQYNDSGAPEDVQRVLDIIVAAGGAAGFIAGAFVFLLAEPIMLIFGEEFVSSANLLRILAAAQMINCLTGATGVTANMTGLHREALVIQFLFATVGIAGAIWVAGIYGAIGVAVVMALATSSWNIATAMLVARRKSLRTWFRFSAVRHGIEALRSR